MEPDSIVTNLESLYFVSYHFESPNMRIFIQPVDFDFCTATNVCLFHEMSSISHQKTEIYQNK